MQNNNAAQNKRFYVYTLADLDQVFYVGKGARYRISAHESEARKGCDCIKCQRIRAIWDAGRNVTRTIVFRSDIECEAHDHERLLIAQFGRENLTNKSDGGEGFSHIPPGYISVNERRKQLYAEVRERINRESPIPQRYWRMKWRDEADRKIKRESEAAEIEIAHAQEIREWKKRTRL